MAVTVDRRSSKLNCISGSVGRYALGFFTVRKRFTEESFAGDFVGQRCADLLVDKERDLREEEETPGEGDCGRLARGELVGVTGPDLFCEARGEGPLPESSPFAPFSPPLSPPHIGLISVFTTGSRLALSDKKSSPK
jgi:hypothetical protein